MVPLHSPLHRACRLLPAVSGVVLATLALAALPSAARVATEESQTTPRAEPPPADAGTDLRLLAQASPGGPAARGTPGQAISTPVPGVGGRGFNLQIDTSGEGAVAARGGASPRVIARWTDGTVETGYQGLRIIPPSTFEPFPAATLGANATSFTDPTPPPVACYVVRALDGASVLGMSDALCLIRGMSPAGAPGHFTGRLDQSNTTTLSWTPPSGLPPGGVGNYLLLVVRLDGSFTPINLPGAATSTTHDTGGNVACYVLVVPGRGNTDALCAVPGMSTLGAGATATTPALQSLAERLDQFVP